MGEIFRGLPREPNSGLGVLIPQPSSATVLTQTTLVTFLPLSHKPQGAIRAQPLL